MKKIALGIIDAQRGFMPVEEGRRLHEDGFGELAVPRGDEIVEPVNLLLNAFDDRQQPTFTTRDYHPHDTAHFGNPPNYTTTWPVHCVSGTPGAKLHPEIVVPKSTFGFIKGVKPLVRGEDDTSYSAYYAEEPITGTSLPDFIRMHYITEIALGGLALDYCVGKSAIDLQAKLGVEVTVVTDATRGITEQSSEEMLKNFTALGIKTTTTSELLRRLGYMGER